MKVRDKGLKESVDVFSKECLTFTCYWPRPNPGSFSIGRGYRSYGDSRDGGMGLRNTRSSWVPRVSCVSEGEIKMMYTIRLVCFKHTTQVDEIYSLHRAECAK